MTGGRNADRGQVKDLNQRPPDFKCSPLNHSTMPVLWYDQIQCSLIMVFIWVQIRFVYTNHRWVYFRNTGNEINVSFFFSTPLLISKASETPPLKRTWHVITLEKSRMILTNFCGHPICSSTILSRKSTCYWFRKLLSAQWKQSSEECFL